LLIADCWFNPQSNPQSAIRNPQCSWPADTPKRSPPAILADAKAAIAPAAIPPAAIRRPFPTISPMTARRSAPSAIRIPISRARRATSYDSTA